MEYSSQTPPYLLSLNPESSQKNTQTVTLSPETEQIETTIDILIVDDVLENIRLLSSILADHGYPTRKATNGLMALRAVEITKPTLILLDIRMPNLSGYAVCQHLKSNPKTAHIPIIFLSATENVEDKAKAFQVGGADYISKPFYVEEVIARVKNQLQLIAAQQTIEQLKKKA